MSATIGNRCLQIHLTGTVPNACVGSITNLRSDGLVAEFGATDAPILLPGQSLRFRVCNSGLGGLANAFDARGTIESREQRSGALHYGVEVADTATFARALHALTDSTSDRRAHSRVPFESGDASAAILHHGRISAWVRTMVLDLSEAGIGVTCSDTFSEHFRVGDPIKLTFRMPGGGAPVTMSGTIRGRLPLDRKVRFGIQFAPPTTPADVSGLRMIGEYVARHLRLLRGIT
ncbi:MAG: PilZ domain-containing protein [Planctomycetes bacterium]|nr:PilZ domain-containing protein [Planctomycetota bacterium]MCC7169944.1 PilZ domain-containing protein [Planctomycetota bacterium]